MDLFEYQARDLFARHNVPVLGGLVATTAEDARAAAADMFGITGCDVVAVKAQVKTGGRGKAGGVKIASSVAEATEAAQDILGMDIKGHTVLRVMIAQGAAIEREFYFAIMLDRASGGYLAIASTHGGMDIEQAARDHPEEVAKVPIDPLVGIDAAKAEEIMEAGGFNAPDLNVPGFNAPVRQQIAHVFHKLWHVFEAEDATLVEVNPLVLTAEGEVVALDAKVTVDDNATKIRHKHRAELAGATPTDPLEARARALGLGYIKLDGQVGVIGNGAGLVMSTLDVVAGAGEVHGIKPANFLDIGGGASAKVMSDGLSIILSDPQVRCVFINVFGGITACDEVARGVLGALDILPPEKLKPLVVRLDGNNVREGLDILNEAHHPLVSVTDSMDHGAHRAADIAAGL